MDLLSGLRIVVITLAGVSVALEVRVAKKEKRKIRKGTLLFVLGCIDAVFIFKLI